MTIGAYNAAKLLNSPSVADAGIAEVALVVTLGVVVVLVHPSVLQKSAGLDIVPLAVTPQSEGSRSLLSSSQPSYRGRLRHRQLRGCTRGQPSGSANPSARRGRLGRIRGRSPRTGLRAPRCYRPPPEKKTNQRGHGRETIPIGPAGWVAVPAAGLAVLVQMLHRGRERRISAGRGFGLLQPRPDVWVAGLAW
jgi:hypothetical protein